MAHLPRSAHELFARQHGAASRDQLIECGLTAKQLELFRLAGTLDQNLRGAYRSPSVPDTELARCASVCLARPHAAIGGSTAGRIHGFRRVGADRRLHITAPRGTNPITTTPGVITFHTDAFRPEDVIERTDGIRLLTPARTAMDLARLLGPVDLRSVIEQVMHDGRLIEIDMLIVAADFVRYRPWVRRYMEAVGSRIAGGPAESHPEVLVGEALVRRGVTGLVRQHRLTVGRRNIRFDFAVPSLRWAIEVDVFPTHAETAGRRADEQRDRATRSIGWDVTRVSREAYESRFAASMDELAQIHRFRLHRSAS
jgi:very-short-patch-repair endonuclease